MTTGDIDDGQPRVTEDNITERLDSAVVGTAMGQCVQHTIDRPYVLRPEASCYTTHVDKYLFSQYIRLGTGDMA